MNIYYVKKIIVSMFVMLLISSCSKSVDSHNVQKATLENQLKGSARMVFIDPDTGEFVTQPTREQLERMNVSNFQRSSRVGEDVPVVEEKLPNGGTKIFLNKRFHKQVIASINENGELEVNHGDVDKYVSSEVEIKVNQKASNQ